MRLFLFHLLFVVMHNILFDFGNSKSGKLNGEISCFEKLTNEATGEPEFYFYYEWEGVSPEKTAGIDFSSLSIQMTDS